MIPCLPCWFLAIANGCRNRIPPNNLTVIYLCLGLSIFTDVQKRCFFCRPFLLFIFCVFHAVLSVHCSLVATCWERAGLLALLYVMFSCVIITFPCVFLVQVWYLIVSIPDFYLLLNYIYHEWASTKNCLFMLSTKRRYSTQHTCYV